jgi:hypothetical protein
MKQLQVIPISKVPSRGFCSLARIYGKFLSQFKKTLCKTPWGVENQRSRISGENWLRSLEKDLKSRIKSGQFLFSEIPPAISPLCQKRMASRRG